MKRLRVLLIAVLFSAFGTAASAASSEFVTGDDWNKRMSAREKYLSLVPPSLLFSEYDVHLKLGLPQYIFLIDQVMLRNPRLQDEEVSNIFASTIYLFEPQNRAALRTMETNFLKGDYTAETLRLPRLTIEDVLGEIEPDDQSEPNVPLLAS